VFLLRYYLIYASFVGGHKVVGMIIRFADISHLCFGLCDGYAYRVMLIRFDYSVSG